MRLPGSGKKGRLPQTQDMTQGSPAKQILAFALPLMLGNVFQQLYTFVDTLVAGQALGVEALAALGGVEWLTFLMFGSIQGLTQGFGVVISQHFGAGEEKEMKGAIFHAAALSAGAACLFAVLAEGLAGPALDLLGTPEAIRGLSLTYLRILFAGIPASFLYNASAAVLRAVGNSRTPLQAMTAASLCNIVLDLLFVFGFGWGIKGAAAATVIAQLLAGLYCARKLAENPHLRPGREDCRLAGRQLWRELRLGLPMCLQNCITASGGLVVQSVVNGFGVTFIAGYTAANKLYGLLEIAASSYGYAMAAFAGQNQGAGKKERIGAGLCAANLIGAGTACMMSAVMLFLGKPILGCFLTGDAALVAASLDAGYRFLRVLAVFFPFLYFLYITRSCIQGMGDAVFPMLSSFVQLFMRVGCALLLTARIGEDGVFYGEALAWLGADLLLFLRYRCLKAGREGGKGGKTCAKEEG